MRLWLGMVETFDLAIQELLLKETPHTSIHISNRLKRFGLAAIAVKNNLVGSMFQG